ncbi:MAG: succinate dehydrogenase assembly factor 2 [Parvibaculaceae bacterium]
MADSADTLDARQRRALWRAGHRGIRELDLLLDRFARSELGSMAPETLTEFERLLEAPDPDLQDWILAGLEAPPPYDGPILAAIRALRFAPDDFTSRS